MELPKPQDMQEFDRATQADLLEAVAARQDRAAFAALFDYFAPRLKAYLMRLGSDSSQAEELVQEVMLTLWRKAGQFDRRQSAVSTWLFTIARNRRIDVLRRQRYPELDPEDPALVGEAPVQPDDAAAAQQAQDRVRAAVAALPPEQAELIREAFFTGLSHSEIAEKTGLPLGTVKSRLRLAFGRLKRALDGTV